jgi:hypothetical protein
MLKLTYQETGIDGIGSTKYKLYNGTHYEESTCDEVVAILDNCIRNKDFMRIRIFYGHTAKNSVEGEDWLEEHDTIGRIGRSNGRIKIPLLLKKVCSYGGGGLLTSHIIRITQNKKDLYRHEKYHLPELRVYENVVLKNGEVIARFENNLKATHYLEFLEGVRNKI